MPPPEERLLVVKVHQRLQWQADPAWRLLREVRAQHVEAEERVESQEAVLYQEDVAEVLSEASSYKRRKCTVGIS